MSSAFSFEGKSAKDDYVIPTKPASEDAYDIAYELPATVLREPLLYSPSHISDFGLQNPVTADAATDTANHQITSWLLLCPIPLPDYLKKDLAVYMSRKEAGPDELLFILLRCLESIRMRVRQIRPGLCDENRREIVYHGCQTYCNEYGCMERHLDKLYEESRIPQNRILARCLHKFELYLNARGTIKATGEIRGLRLPILVRI
jgi:hypothetical protein